MIKGKHNQYFIGMALKRPRITSLSSEIDFRINTVIEGKAMRGVLEYLHFLDCHSHFGAIVRMHFLEVTDSPLLNEGLCMHQMATNIVGQTVPFFRGQHIVPEVSDLFEVVVVH